MSEKPLSEPLDTPARPPAPTKSFVIAKLGLHCGAGGADRCREGMEWTPSLWAPWGAGGVHMPRAQEWRWASSGGRRVAVGTGELRVHRCVSRGRDHFPSPPPAPLLQMEGLVCGRRQPAIYPKLIHKSRFK